MNIQRRAKQIAPKTVEKQQSRGFPKYNLHMMNHTYLTVEGNEGQQQYYYESPYINIPGK